MLPPIECTPFDYSLISMTAFSVLLEIFVLWLILKKSAPSLHEYRFYLCGTTFSDLLFAVIVGFVIEPDPWIPASLGTGVKGLGRWLDWDYAGPFVFSLSVFAISSQLQFQMFAMFFRYVIVMGRQYPRLKEFLLKKSTKIGILGIIISLSTFTAGISMTAFTSRLNQFVVILNYRNYMKPIINSSWINPVELPQIQSTEMDAILASEQIAKLLGQVSPEDSDAIIQTIRSMHLSKDQQMVLQAFRQQIPIIYPDWAAALPMLLTMGTMLFGLFVFQILCIIMGVAIIRYLRKNSKDFVLQAYKMHMQLIVLLIIQLIEPFLFIVLPVFYAIYGLLQQVIQIYLPYPGLSNNGMHFGILLFAFYPMVNSLLTVTFISSYRKFIFKILHLEWLCRMLKRENANQVGPMHRQMYPVSTTKTQ